MGKLVDDFKGDTDRLIVCIEALLQLDEAKALAPHGIGGHARGLLSAAGVRLAAKDREIAELNKRIDALIDQRNEASTLQFAEMRKHDMTKFERDEARERITELETAMDQAVALAEYVESHAKGSMVEKVKKFLSNDFAKERDGYYIACFRHRRDEAHEMVLWWRAGRDGYTTDLAQAGIYHDKHENGVDDVAVPVAFARKRRRFEVIDPWADGNVMFQTGALLLAALAKESAAPEPTPV